MTCDRHASGTARDAAAHHQAAAELSTRLAERGTGITSALCHLAATRKTAVSYSVHAEKLAPGIQLKNATHLAIVRRLAYCV